MKALEEAPARDARPAMTAAGDALAFGELETPLGTLLVVAGPRGLRAVEFADHDARMRAHLARWFGGAATQRRGDPAGALPRLRAYFAGDLGALDGLAVDPGGTPFQRAVWNALRAIPAGETRSYADIARAVGRPSAVRAVGAANGRNPVAIVVPCHRVVGSDGSLTGYAGGIARKRWLLAHEGAVRSGAQQSLLGG